MCFLYHGLYVPPGAKKPQEVVIQKYHEYYNMREHNYFDCYYSFMNALSSNHSSKPFQVLPFALNRTENVMIFQKSDYEGIHLVELLDVCRDNIARNHPNAYPPPHLLMRILLDVATGIRYEQQGERIPANHFATMSETPLDGMLIGNLSTSRAFANTRAIQMQGAEVLNENLRKFALNCSEHLMWMPYIRLDLLAPNTVLARTSEVLTTRQTNVAELSKIRPPENVNEVNNETSDAYRFGMLAWQVWLLFDASSPNITYNDTKNIFHMGIEPKDENLRKIFSRVKDAPPEFSKTIMLCLSRDPNKRPTMEAIQRMLQIEYRRLREEYIKKNKLEAVLSKIPADPEIKLDVEAKRRVEGQLETQVEGQAEGQVEGRVGGQPEFKKEAEQKKTLDLGVSVLPPITTNQSSDPSKQGLYTKFQQIPKEQNAPKVVSQPGEPDPHDMEDEDQPEMQNEPSQEGEKREKKPPKK